MAKKPKPPEPEKDPTAAPGWALTFGDLMTQLLTFFILLFSVSEIKQQKIYDTLKAFRTRVNLDWSWAGYSLISTAKIPQALSQRSIKPPDHQGSAGQTIMEWLEKQLQRAYMPVLKKETSVKQSIAETIYFNPASAVLNDDEKLKISQFAKRSRGYGTEINIIGYTAPARLPLDAPFDHMNLSIDRAQAVMNYLIQCWQRSGHGVDVARLKISAVGRHGPKKSSPVEYDRVEIIDTGKKIQ